MRLLCHLACIVGIIATLFLTHPSAQPNRAKCAPELIAGVHVSGNRVLCFDHELPANVSAQMAAGLDYWTTAFSQNNIDISFTIQST
jgi:hypothetical protein